MRLIAMSAPTHPRSFMPVIDRIRHDIQQRLDQLLAEAEKLGHALAALDPREQSARSRARAAKSPQAEKPPVPKASSPRSSVTPKRTASRSGAASTPPSSAASTPARTAPGETKAKVLGALSRDQPLTAGDVAKATGLARATISTTLSKLAKSGAVIKAQRGYHLPGETADPSAAEPRTESVNAE
jgi:DNA-binding transcriptional ArsR family regulator